MLTYPTWITNLNSTPWGKWQRIIELTAGCHHMTCRCGNQFCFTCGGMWDVNHFYLYPYSISLICRSQLEGPWSRRRLRGWWWYIAGVLCNQSREWVLCSLLCIDSIQARKVDQLDHVVLELPFSPLTVTQYTSDWFIYSKWPTITTVHINSFCL